MTVDTLASRAGKPLVFGLCLMPLMIPLVSVVLHGFVNVLGVNPVEAITHRTGDWTLRFLLITLAISPLRRVTDWSWPIRFRRMLGLFAFFYTTLHFLTYLVLDKFFWWQDIWADIAKRPYITVGFAAFVLLIPLAVTSTQGMMRRLQHRWQRLHRLIYVIAILGVVHFWWLIKADVREPAVYAGLLSMLLGYRLMHWIRRQLREAEFVLTPRVERTNG